MLHLPVECISMIFEYMEPLTNINISCINQTSKSFRDAVLLNNKLIKVLHFSQYTLRLCCERAEEKFFAQFISLETLVFINCTEQSILNMENRYTEIFKRSDTIKRVYCIFTESTILSKLLLIRHTGDPWFGGAKIILCGASTPFLDTTTTTTTTTNTSIIKIDHPTLSTKSGIALDFFRKHPELRHPLYTHQKIFKAELWNLLREYPDCTNFETEMYPIWKIFSESFENCGIQQQKQLPGVGFGEYFLLEMLRQLRIFVKRKFSNINILLGEITRWQETFKFHFSVFSFLANRGYDFDKQRTKSQKKQTMMILAKQIDDFWVAKIYNNSGKIRDLPDSLSVTNFLKRARSQEDTEEDSSKNDESSFTRPTKKFKNNI